MTFVAISKMLSHHAPKYTGIANCELDIQFIRRPDMENKIWLHYTWQGKTNGGREFEIVEDIPVLCEVESIDPIILGSYIGLRIREATAHLNEAEKAGGNHEQAVS